MASAERLESCWKELEALWEEASKAKLDEDVLGFHEKSAAGLLDEIESLQPCEGEGIFCTVPTFATHRSSQLLAPFQTVWLVSAGFCNLEDHPAPGNCFATS